MQTAETLALIAAATQTRQFGEGGEDSRSRKSEGGRILDGEAAHVLAILADERF